MSYIEKFQKPCMALLLLLSLLLSMLFVYPLYNRYTIRQKMRPLQTIVDQIQTDFVHHLQRYGSFPKQDNVFINDDKLYDIVVWTNHPNTLNGQIAIIQAGLNGKELNLKAGEGGMITCLMAHKHVSVESKCFYQIKQM